MDHSRERVDRLILALLAASLALNVYQGVQAMRPAPGRAVEPALKVGAVVPPLEVKDLRGMNRRITYGDTRRLTVLYFFTPSCPWCKKNLPSIRTLAEQQGSSYRLIAVSLQPVTADYMKESEIDFPVFVEPAPGSRAVYGLGSIPQTVVVSPEGKVVKNWVGAYYGSLRDEIGAFLFVALPSLPRD